jgi:hypothetical protein
MDTVAIKVSKRSETGKQRRPRAEPFPAGGFGGYRLIAFHLSHLVAILPGQFTQGLPLRESFFG